MNVLHFSDFPDDVEDKRKWMLDHTLKIDSKCQKLFEWFFKVNEVPVERMPNYNCIPYQCELLGNYRFRWQIVEDAGVRYLCFIKQMDSPGRPYHYIFSYDILPSVKGADVEAVKQVWKKVGVDKETFFCEKNHDNCNFYNLKDEAARMDSHKWKRKHGIDKMKELIEVRGSFDSPEVIEGFKEMMTEWYKAKNDLYRLTTRMGGKSHELKVTEFPKDENIIHRIYLFQGKVIGYACLTRFCGHLFAMVGKHSAQSDAIKDDYVRARIGYFMKWDSHQLLLNDDKAEALFSFGCSRNKPLRIYKEKIYKHVLSYDTMPIR